MGLKQKVWLIMFFCFFAGGITTPAQDYIAQPDTAVLSPDTVVLPLAQEPADSLFYNPTDTIPADSLLSDSYTFDDTIMVDSLAVADTIPPKPGLLEAPVTYQARDSIVLTAGNMAYLYGEGDVRYQQIQLQAELIEMNMDSTVVFATYVVDSTGVEVGYPLYIDGTEQVEAKNMSYNFKTGRAYAKDVLTQQGEGYLTSRVAKKMEDNSMNLMDGQYTT